MHDVITLAGFLTLLIGVGWLSLPLAFITAGLILLAAGLYARFRGGFDGPA